MWPVEVASSSHYLNVRDLMLRAKALIPDEGPLLQH